jgi:hypothetical protein
MGGSLVANASTEKGRWMQQDLASLKDPTHGGLYKSDAVALLKNSVDFPERSAVINTNAEGLADWLQEHPDVQTVYYPKSSPHYAQVQSESGGFGGLFSIILHRHMCQRTFYDALDVAKGPSLGTNFTLVCPYTLLAHYHELDFAMSCVSLWVWNHSKCSSRNSKRPFRPVDSTPSPQCKCQRRSAIVSLLLQLLRLLQVVQVQANKVVPTRLGRVPCQCARVH